MSEPIPIIYDFNRKAKFEGIFNTFTQSHLTRHKTLFSKEAHPYLFDTKAIKFKKAAIINRNLIKSDDAASKLVNYRSQSARTGGAIKTTKMNELVSSFHVNGYKLANSLPCVYTPNDKNYLWITGHSRDRVFEMYNFDNAMVNIYGPAKKDMDSDTINNELSQLGNKFNPRLDPAVPASMLDIQREGIRACRRGWVDVEPNLGLFDRIKDRLQPQADAIKLSENKLNYVVANVMNLATDTEYQILPFDMLDAKEWMKTNMYIDIPGKVRYVVKAYDMARAAVVEGIQYASKHPKEEIRLVIHVGVLGGDAETDYDNRVVKFWSKKEEILSAFQQVIFGGKTQDIQNFKLYGIIPAVGNVHNLNKLNIFNQVDGSYSQK